MKKTLEKMQNTIRKKIAESGICKPEQYEQIISKLISQRERLQADLVVLREKVKALQQKKEKKNLTKTIIKRISPSKNGVNYREQLKRKYEQLRHLQKKSSKTVKSQSLELQYRTYLDKLCSIEQQIQTVVKQLEDEKITYQRLKKAYKFITKEDKANNTIQESIERQNYQLRKRVGSLRKIVDQQLSKEIDLHSYLVAARERKREVNSREKQVQERERESRNNKRSSTYSSSMNRIKTQQNFSAAALPLASEPSLSDSDVVSLEIQFSAITSKQQIYQIQGNLNRMESKFRLDVALAEKKIKKYPNEALLQKRDGSKLSYSKQFELILQKSKSILNAFCDLNRHKVKILYELLAKNLSERELPIAQTSLIKRLHSDDFSEKSKTEIFERKQYQISSLAHKNENRTRNIVSQKAVELKKYVNEQSQTYESLTESRQALRREYIGLINDLQSNDRDLLKGNTYASIKTLHIYYSERGIASIKAVYCLEGDKQQLQSELMIPKQFIDNYCQIYSIQTTVGDFIRYFKIKYSKTENRIVNIKIVTHKNVKTSFGDSKIKNEEARQNPEVQYKEYVFDIGKDEFPVSIFCSHEVRGPYWYLCGFGVEINDL